MKTKFHKWTLLIALFFISTVQQGYATESEISMEQVNRIFPNAVNTQTVSNSEYLVFDNAQKKIGRVIVSSPSADNIVGYFGPVPLLIGFDLNGNIAGVLLLKNRETAEYVVQVENSGLLSQWDGLSAKEALKKQVDVVSGATLTSRAVIRTFQKRVSEDVQSSSGSGLLWIGLLGGVVLLGLIFYFFKRRK